MISKAIPGEFDPKKTALIYPGLRIQVCPPLQLGFSVPFDPTKDPQLLGENAMARPRPQGPQLLGGSTYLDPPKSRYKKFPEIAGLKKKGTTLQGINISHLGKRKIIFKMPFWGDMLVPWRVFVSIGFQVDQPKSTTPWLRFGRKTSLTKSKLKELHDFLGAL